MLTLPKAISLLRTDAPSNSRVSATECLVHAANGHPLVTRYFASVEYADGTKDETSQFDLDRAVDLTLGKMNFRAAYPEVARVCDELGLEYIGAQERPGLSALSLFTDVQEGSPSYRGTFPLPDADLTPDRLRAARTKMQASFLKPVPRAAALVA